MSHCPEHEQLKIDVELLKNKKNGSSVTWNKFILIMISIITIGVTATGLVTHSLAKATERVEIQSLERDKESAKCLKDYMEKIDAHTLQTKIDIASIKTALGIKDNGQTH